MPSYFEDKARPPNEHRLKDALGSTYPVWRDLERHLGQLYGDIEQEWRYYGKNYGWTLKVRRKKRALFYLVPQKDHFELGFTFGDKAVAAAEGSDLPSRMLAELRSARRYVEGRGLRVNVPSARALKSVKTLVAITLAN